MNSTLRLLFALLMLPLRTITLHGPHRLLPHRVRLASLGFVSLVVLFAAASLSRHVWAASGSLGASALAAALMLLLVLAFAGREHLGEAALYLSASIGVDCVAIALSMAGVDLRDGEVRLTLLLWEAGATIAAIWAMRAEHAREKTDAHRSAA